MAQEFYLLAFGNAEHGMVQTSSGREYSGAGRGPLPCKPISAR